MDSEWVQPRQRLRLAAHVVVVREGKNLKGRLLEFVVGTIGKGVLEKAFANSIKAIEARNQRGASAGHSMND